MSMFVAAGSLSQIITQYLRFLRADVFGKCFKSMAARFTQLKRLWKSCRYKSKGKIMNKSEWFAFLAELRLVLYSLIE